MKNVFFLALIFSISIFAGCRTTTSAGSGGANGGNENAGASSEIRQISVEQAKRAVEETGAQFIDVRTPEEYRGGHAPKAVNFPLDNLEENLVKLDKQKPVYVICQTGRRSQKAAEILQKAGFGELYNVAGGTSAWESAGLPIEKSER